MSPSLQHSSTWPVLSGVQNPKGSSVPRSARWPLLLFVVLLGALVGGLVHLFHLRFEAGDVYPEYSTLRSDPLGAKVFFESLSRLVPTKRHFRSLSKLDDRQDAVLFLLGVDSSRVEFQPLEWRRLDDFVQRGGRVVIAFRPRYEKFPGRPMAPSPASPRLGKRGDGSAHPPGGVSLQDHWRVSFGHEPLQRGEDGVFRAERAWRKGGALLPESIDMHTALTFEPPQDLWTVQLARRPSPTNERPVLIERAFGHGSVVLAADAYGFSNEALRNERHPALLTWIVGSASRAIFDESHLGVQENPGVATLARQYHLEGLFTAVLILAGLFVWRSASSFLPPRAEKDSPIDGEPIRGRDAAAGFTNLLRRNLPRQEVLTVCLEQWNNHVGRVRPPSTDRLAAMQRLIETQNDLPPRQRDPVTTYREFCKILQRKR